MIGSDRQRAFVEALPAERLSIDAGFRIETLEMYATQAKRLAFALENRITVSAGVVAQRA